MAIDDVMCSSNTVRIQEEEKWTLEPIFCLAKLVSEEAMTSSDVVIKLGLKENCGEN